MYDVVIAGAGPAGSTLARLLSSRYRVLLVDRRSELDTAMDPRSSGDTSACQMPKKLCGGLLAPAAQKELARQGLGVPASVLEGPQLFAVRTVDHDAGLERLYQRHYLNVDREAFDRWLVSLVPDRVERSFGWRLSGVEPAEDGVMVRFLTSSGGRASALTRLLIGADGGGSAVRALAFPDRPAPRYVAIQAVFSAGGVEPHYGAVFDSALTDYYGWTVPKGDTLLVGAALQAGAGAAARFDGLVARLRTRGVTLGEERWRGAAPVVRPARARDIVLGSEQVMLAGEAAGLISPSSAEGISYALRSGAALAHALETGIAGAGVRYRRAVAPVAAEVVAKLGKSRAIHGPLVRRAVMASGLGAIPERGLGGLAGLAGELLAP